MGATPENFTRPSLAIFTTLMTAWVLTPGRRTVTRMISVGDPDGRRCHDAYHRFLRCGRWTMTTLWKSLAQRLVARFCPDGPIIIDCDDTLFHKTGRNINGAGSFRDAVRSTRKPGRVRHRAQHGGDHPAGQGPVGWRTVGPARELPPVPQRRPHPQRPGRQHGHLLAAWLPGRCFVLCADGAYASLAGRGLPRTQVCSRMRRDAALYEPAPSPTGRRGRPAKKGPRLPTPEGLAAVAHDWKTVQIDWRGRTVTRHVWSRPVLWYSVCPKAMVMLVVVRDPAGVEHDDYFFTTDLAAPGAVASLYAGRWSIEDTFRATKQSLGGEDPQSWKHQGPERAASLSLWLHANIWAWYLTTQGTTPTWTPRPWYTAKRTPSFADALACLRRTLWATRIDAAPTTRPQHRQISDTLIDILAEAA